MPKHRSPQRTETFAPTASTPGADRQQRPHPGAAPAGLGLIVIYVGIFSPFSTLLLRTLLGQIPEAIWEAARIDGAPDADGGRGVRARFSLEAATVLGAEAARRSVTTEGASEPRRRSEEWAYILCHVARGVPHAGGSLSPGSEPVACVGAT
jgi:hypothetical protein